jgi:ankyrin repeat protein
LHYAARYGHADAVSYLLASKGVNVNAQTNSRMTPVHLAVSIGNRGIVSLLLGQESINVNVVNRANETPLNLARANNYDEIAFLLESKDAIANADVVSAEDRSRARNLNSRGTKEHGKGAYAKAKTLYLQAIEADPKDPGQNKVSNNEGAEAPRQQGARTENTLLYSTDEQRCWRGCSGSRVDSLF